MRVLQEFYCGECHKFFDVKLNVALNHEIHVRCPGCGHEHRRCIENGLIKENGRYKNDLKETVVASKASLRDKPFSKAMQLDKYKRDGKLLTEAEAAARAAGALALSESWQNKAETDKGDYL